MKLNNVNQIVVTETDAIQALYQQKQISNIVVEDTSWIERYNNLTTLFDFADSRIKYETQSELSSSEFVNECLKDWSLPEQYCTLDIADYLFSRCTTDVQTERVQLELAEFEKRNMTQVLQFLIYFIDKLEENKIVWGVGRGSSVASYVLFLIGVHKIDSIKYDLDIKEFLK